MATQKNGKTTPRKVSATGKGKTTRSKAPAKKPAAKKPAAKKAEQDSIGVTEKTAEEAVIELRKKGMEVHIQTPAETKAWSAVMQKPVMDGFIKASPEDGPKLIDAINKL